MKIRDIPWVKLFVFGISVPLTHDGGGLENPATWLAGTATARCFTESPGPSKSAGCAEATGLIRSAAPWCVAGSSRGSQAWSSARSNARSARTSSWQRIRSGAEHELPQLILGLVFIDFDAGPFVRTGDAGDCADLIAARDGRSGRSGLARIG